MKWIEADGLQLDCEQILYYTDTPEIFICTDQLGARYLIVFEDDTEYLLVPVPLKDIKLLVNKRITICECVRRQSLCHDLHYYDGQYHMTAIEMNSLDSDLLPDEGIYIDAAPDVIRYYNGL